MGKYVLLFFLLSHSSAYAISHQVQVTATVLPTPEWEALQLQKNTTSTSSNPSFFCLLADYFPLWRLTCPAKL